MAFLPNENSRASLLLDYVVECMEDVGDSIGYEQVFEVCGIDDTDKLDQAGMLLSGIIDTVNKRLHRAGDWRHLQNVARVGYCIGSPATIRSEVMGRHRQMVRSQVRALRATEKVVRHPDATPSERKRAADCAANQAAHLDMMRRHNREVGRIWIAEEVSPIPEATA